MKKYFITLTLFILFLILFTFLSMFFVGSSDLLFGFGEHSCEEELTKLLPPGYKLAINREWVKIYNVDINEPYKAWTIRYSDGLIYDGNGKWRSLYREPTMSHIDMKDFDFGVER